jgi:hypothetical protein
MLLRVARVRLGKTKVTIDGLCPTKDSRRVVIRAGSKSSCLKDRNNSNMRS